MTTLADIQRHVGVNPDGVWGPNTAAAIAKALGMGQASRKLSDPAAFFGKLRGVTGSLDQEQVDVVNFMLEKAAHWPTSWVAYALATAWHEARFRPIPEIGRGRGKKYGVAGARMRSIPSPPMYGGQIPYGRGLVQLTWNDNYEWADNALGLNGTLLADFDRALELPIAADILVKGMQGGKFTGKGLSDYLPGETGTRDQFKQARRIINGTDRAEMIAAYAGGFQDALKKGGW